MRVGTLRIRPEFELELLLLRDTVGGGEELRAVERVAGGGVLRRLWVGAAEVLVRVGIGRAVVREDVELGALFTVVVRLRWVAWDWRMFALLLDPLETRLRLIVVGCLRRELVLLGTYLVSFPERRL